MRATVAVSSVFWLIACASAPSRPASPAVVNARPSAPALSAPAQPSASGPAQLALAHDYFASERVHGGIALFDTQTGQLACSDRALCTEARLPASTFKIALTLIALELGVLDDAESKLPWDGKQYQVPAWNQDHTLRTAIQVSCEPCFRGIARQIGPERMRDWVTRIDYGNRDVAGTPDSFWLDGALRISPLQQLDFMRRLDAGTLPLSSRTLDIARDVLTLDVGTDYVLRGKTGSALPPEQPMEAGWFVGWLELAERRVFFATLIDSHAPGIDVAPLRRSISERVLRDLNVLPR